MKVGFLGNTNNYPFVIASQFKELGCDVVIYIDAPVNETLNRPEYHNTGIKYPYPIWIKEDLSLRKSLHIHFPQLLCRNVLKELNSCDAVIVNDYGHRFLNYISPAVHKICMFSGADLEIMADYKNVRNMYLVNPKLRILPGFIKEKIATFSVNQLRKGIATASLISYFPEGLIPYGDTFIKEIFKNKPYQRFNHLHVSPAGFDYCPPTENETFRIFSFTRHMWKTPFPPGRSILENKGNDIMLKGIALYLKKYSKPLDIHFIEKGLHIEESKELITQLGFSHLVTWHKEMPFKELNAHIQKADAVFEQMGTHFISGGFFAMLQGRPVIGNARPEIFDVITEESTPVCHATTPDDVCYWINELAENRNKIEIIGKKSRQYILQHFDVINETRYFKNFLEKLTTKANA